MKALNGYVFEIEVEGETWLLLDAWRFTQTFAEVQFEYRRGNLTATRNDFVPQDRPVLFTTLALRNDGDRQLDVRLTFFIYFDLEDAWFTSLVNQRNDGEIVESDAGKLIARADRSPDNWAVVVGGGSPPEQTQVIDGSDGHPVGQMEYTAILGVGDEKTWRFGVVVESEAGPEIASRNLDQWLPQYETLLSEKRALYETLMITGPQCNSPDERLNAAFNIARANMQMLEAESEALGRYFYAGLENFPFWFGNDGAYSAPGLVASSFVTSTKNHRLDGAQFNSNGRIPPRFLPQVRSSVWETRKKHLNG